MVVVMPRVDSIPCDRGNAVTPNTTLTSRAVTLACAFGLSLLLAPAANAQDVRRISASDNPTLIDQKVGDRNSLATSSRVMQVDLSPHGFERLYAVPGRDDLMMRTNGALYAVFSQSAYIRDPQKKGALKAVVPAATIFYIGRPDFRVIPSTGVRDINFIHDDHSDYSKRPSTAMTSMNGVQRMDGTPIDGRAAVAQSARIDGRIDAPATAKTVRAPDEDISYPARSPEPMGPPPPDVADQSAAPVLRAAQPGFSDRIDELMRRAKKAQ
jgi:hypothetical protein